MTAVLLLAMLPPAARASSDDAPGQGFESWVRSGTGMVTDIVTSDIDDDGISEVIVGGRGVALADAASRGKGRFKWSNKWIQPDGSHAQGDWDIVSEMAVADVTGDGIDDVVVGAGEAPYVMDGDTGEAVWTFSDNDYASPTEPHFEASDGAWRIAVADLNGDGTKDVAFADLWDDGVTAVDIKNDSRLWYVARTGAVMDMHAGDVNLDGAPDIVVVGAPTTTNFEVSAIAGNTGVTLWSQPFLGLPDLTIGDLDVKGDPVAIEIGNVLPGATPQVIVGGATAEVEVMDGASGLPLAFWKTPLPVIDMVLTEIDGDAQQEVITTATDLSREPTGGSVVAYDGGGALLWTQEAAGPPLDLELANVDGSAGDELVVGSGFRTPDGRSELDGAVEVMDVALLTTDRVEWTQLVPEWVATVTVGEFQGEPVILGGQGQEGGVAAFSGDGEKIWKLRTGGRIEMVAPANLDGHGTAEIIEVADDSFVAAHDASGDTLWEARVPGLNGPDVIEVVATDLGAGPTDEIVVGTFDFGFADEYNGHIHAYSSDGDKLWSIGQPGAVNALIADDMDSDGATDIVTATSIEGHAGRYAADGGTVWETAIGTGTHAEAVVADINSDSVKDVIVVTKEWNFTGQMYGLDGVDGSELWYRAVPRGLNWIDLEAGRVAVGDLSGGVYEIDPVDGSDVWFAETGSSSWDGGWTIDVDTDGAADVVSTTELGATHAISSSDGSVMWEAPTTEAQRGFQVTTVSGPDGPLIVAGTFSGRGPSAIQVLDAFTGAEHWSVLTHSYLMDIIGVDLSGDGIDEIVAGAGWNLHALTVD